MARPYTVGQRNLVKSPNYQLNVKVEVQSASGGWQDFSALAGVDWRSKIVWRHTIDQPTMEGSVTFLREAGPLSLSPLMSAVANTVNQSGGVYVPAFEGGRGVRISTCYTATGVAPLSTDYHEDFLGVIANPDWGGRDTNAITGVIRDIGYLLTTKWPHVEKTYGSTAGVSLESAIQSILDDNIEAKFKGFATGSNGINASTGAITLYTPVASGVVINQAFTFPVGPVLQGIRDLAAQSGWDVKFRYDSAGNFRLTLFNPPRSNVTPIDTFTGDEYFEIPRFGIPDDDVRNNLDIFYTDAATGAVLSVNKTNATSIAKYGERYHRLTMGATAVVNSATLANALAVVVDSDLSLPYATQDIETSFAWFIDNQDLYTFTPNGRLYDTSQNLAVVGYEHTLEDGDGTTVMNCRAQVAGLYRNWITGGGDTSDAPAPVITSIVGTFTGTGLEVQLQSDGAANSWRIVAQTGSAPTLAAVRAATPVAAFAPLVTYVGSFSAGTRVYIAALAYRDTAGTVSESVLKRQEVVKSGSGLGSPPTAVIDEVGTKTRGTATLTFRGALGAGASGALTWQYAVDGDTTAASWTSPSSTALPVTVGVSRLTWAAKTVLLRVTQADGQYTDATYEVASRMDALDTTTGGVVRAFAMDDGGYSTKASDASGFILSSSAQDSGLRSVGAMFSKSSDTLDVVPEGSTYKRALATRINAGRPVIDLSEAIHSNTTLQYLSDAPAAGRFAGSQVAATGEGSQVFSNPEFVGGSVAGCNAYDNNGTGRVTLAAVADASAPNSSGYKLRITVAAPGAAINPGVGGFTTSTPVDSGVFTPDTYHQGASYIVRLRALIPVGYTIQWTANPYGTGSSSTWLTAQLGTGAWAEYALKITAGVGGTLSTLGFWYLTGTDAAITWYVALNSLMNISAAQGYSTSFVQARGGGRADPNFNSSSLLLRARGLDDGAYAAQAGNAAGTTLNSSVTDNGGRLVNVLFSKSADTMDVVADGSTYGKASFTRLLYSDRAGTALDSSGRVLRGNAFSDGVYATRSNLTTGLDIQSGVTDALTGQALNTSYFRSLHTADNIAQGATSKVPLLSTLDASGTLKTAVGFSATVAGLSAARISRGAESAWRESFAVNPNWPDAGWGLGTQSIVTGATGATGSAILNVSGMGSGLGPTIPFNPLALYRLRIRMRTTVNATTGSVPAQFYAGVWEYDAGGGSIGIPAAWKIVTAANPVVASGWVVYEGWVKGNAAGTGSGSSSSTDPLAPATLAYNTAQFGLVWLANYSGSNSNMQLDYFEVIAYDEDAQNRIYQVANSTGNIRRARALDDGYYPSRATDTSGLVLHGSVTDSGSRVVTSLFSKTGDTLDQVPEGSTYRRVAGVNGSNLITPTSSSGRSRCSVYHSTSQSVSDSTDTLLTFDSELYDVGALHDTSTNPSRITIPTGGNVGIWQFTASISWDGLTSGGAGTIRVWVRKNGTTTLKNDRRQAITPTAAGYGDIQTVTATDDSPSVGDYYQVLVNQTSGVTRSIQGAAAAFSAIHLW